MKKLLSYSLLAALLLPFGMLQAQDKKPPVEPPKEIAPAVQVFFDFNKFEVKKSEMVKIDQLIKDLKSKKEFQIWLTGHTDSTGNDEYNNELSKNRVDEVFNYMAEKGIPEDAMQPSYYGRARPLGSEGKNEEKSAKSRRVEITIYEKPKAVVVPKPKVKDTCGHDTTISAGDGVFITMNKCEYTKLCKSNPNCITVKKVLEVEEIFDSGSPLTTSKGEGFVWGGILTTSLPGDTCLKGGAKISYGLDKDAYKRSRFGAMKKKGDDFLETDRGTRISTKGGKEEVTVTVPISCPGVMTIAAPCGKSKQTCVKDKTGKASEMYLVSNSPATIIPGIKKGNKFYFSYSNVPSPKLYIKTADGDLIKDIDVDGIKKAKKAGTLNKGYKLKPKNLGGA